MDVSVVDEETVLRLYGLSDLQPRHWEDVETDETTTNLELQAAGIGAEGGPGGSGRVREIEDPLGLSRALKM